MANKAGVLIFALSVALFFLSWAIGDQARAASTTVAAVAAKAAATGTPPPSSTWTDVVDMNRYLRWLPFVGALIGTLLMVLGSPSKPKAT